MLSTISAVIIIIDVLSFSTSVDIAVSQGAAILPFPFHSESVEEFATSNNAVVAAKNRRGIGYSLSPQSLTRIPSGTRLVLPSPNGSVLSLSTGNCITLAGCFRNASAIAEYAQSVGGPIAVIACGERWPDGSLRPCFEDTAAAGAIIHALTGTKSPESLLAEATFVACKDSLLHQLTVCSSGKELIERGFAEDVKLAAQLNVSQTVPKLVGNAYQSV